MIGTGSWRAALVAVDDAQKRADRPCPGRRTARSSSACRLPRLPRRQAPIFRNANPTPLRCLWLDDRRGLRRKHRDANSASPPRSRHRAPVGCARTEPRTCRLRSWGPQPMREHRPQIAAGPQFRWAHHGRGQHAAALRSDADTRAPFPLPPMRSITATGQQSSCFSPMAKRPAAVILAN